MSKAVIDDIWLPAKTCQDSHERRKNHEDARHQKWVANFESALGDDHLALEYREGSECMTLLCLLRQELGEVGHFRKRNGSSRSFDSHLIHNR